MSSNKLSIEQEKSINHFTGPALVVAGPGSGKTTVIVNRINHLIYQRHIRPESILVITFSKMAAISMQARFNQNGIYLPVTFATFHSLFFNIIQQSTNQKFNVVTHRRKCEILTEVLNNANLSDNLENEYLEAILKRISFYKNSNNKNDNSTLCKMNDKSFMQVLHEYNNALKCNNLIDFDDMMLLCNELLEEDLEVKNHYQQMFEYILIDEFQDINSLQYEIIKKLSDNHNIFVVGDDDQSIYGFRGSNPKIMQQFFKDFKDVNIIRLGCNYRSSSEIVALASKIIVNNENRINKNIYTNNLYKGIAKILCYESKEEQNEAIVQNIIESNRNNAKDNMCILYRNNVSVSRMVELLINRNIKCEILEKAENAFDNIIFKDFCCYLRMSHSKVMEAKDLLAVMNKPIRYISRKDINIKNTDLTLLKGIYKEKEYVVRKITKLEKDLMFMKDMDLYSAFYYFRKVIGYEDYLVNQYEADNRLLNKKIAYLNDMQSNLREYSSYEEIEKVSRQLNEMKTKDRIMIEPGKVYIMTYHSSKGLEFDKVWIPDMMEGECPSSKSITDIAIEEERRMLYVAMTRAKKELYMSYINGKNDKKLLKSRFISELEK